MQTIIYAFVVDHFQDRRFLTILTKIKLPFIKITTELNVESLAAITFQMAKIYSVYTYAPCWEWEQFSTLKSAKSTM